MNHPDSTLPATEPPPLPPPIAPAMQPVPVIPYVVANRAFAARPLVVSMVGPISMVVACLSALFSFVGGFQVSRVYMESQASARQKSIPGATSSTTLTPTEIDGTIRRAQSSCGGKLNLAQVDALTIALQDPNQKLVSPGTAWSPVRNANVQPDGSAIVVFSGEMVMLNSQGNIQYLNISSTRPTIHVDSWILMLSALHNLLSLVLAALLFIAGLSAVQSSFAARKLHLIYATFKLPLGIATGLMWSAYISSVNKTGSLPFSMAASFSSVFGLALNCLGLIYPIILLLMMNTQGVREFYSRSPIISA